MNQLSLRNNKSKFKTSEKYQKIVLKESMRYTLKDI